MRSRIKWPSSFGVALALVAFMSLVSSGEATESSGKSESTLSKKFRVPAKRVGNKFVIKLEMKQGLGSYVVEAWLDPSEKWSTLDVAPMKELGWRGVVQDWSEVSASGHTLPVWRFKSGINETAHLPEYVQSCCEIKLGQDVLSQFQVKAVELAQPTKISEYIFDSAYVEFVRVDELGSEKSSFLIVEPEYTWKVLQRPLFQFQFIPPSRKVLLTTKFQNIPKGSEWVSVNGKRAAVLDFPVLNRYITGKKEKVINLEFKTPDRKTVTVPYEF